MKLQLEVEFDLTKVLERECVEFLDQNREMTKDVILGGYVYMGSVKKYAMRDDPESERLRGEIEDLNRVVKNLIASNGIVESAALARVKHEHAQELENLSRMLSLERASRKASLEADLERQTAAQALEKECELLKRDVTLANMKAAHNESLSALKVVHNDTMTDMKIDCERYKRMYSDATSGSHRAQVSQLESLLTDARAEMNILKRSNAGKGNLGEFAIGQFVRSAYPSFEVLNTGKQDASCDLHVRVNEEQRYFAVESKNKIEVTKGDIDKFYRDCECLSLSNKFMGAVFVSLRSRNIPGKGAFSLEFDKDMRPLIFAGFEDPSDLTFLKHCIDLLIEVSMKCSGLDRGNDVRDRLAPLVKRVSSLRKEIDGIKECAGKIGKSCDSIYAAVTHVFDEIVSLTPLPRVIKSSKTKRLNIIGPDIVPI